MADTIARLLEISSKIDHLQNSAEWVAKETVHQDATISQTATLIYVIAEDIREQLCELVQSLEKETDQENLH